MALCLPLLMGQVTIGLTLVGVTSFDVAGDADHRQRVDAAQTEHQREEAVHLEDR